MSCVHSAWHITLNKCWQLLLCFWLFFYHYFTFCHTFQKRKRNKEINIRWCFLSPLTPEKPKCAHCHEPLTALWTLLGSWLSQSHRWQHHTLSSQGSVCLRQTVCLLFGTLASSELLQPPGSLTPGARIGSFFLHIEQLSLSLFIARDFNEARCIVSKTSRFHWCHPAPCVSF